MQTVFRGLGVSANSTRTSKLQWDAGDAGPGTVLWLLPRLLGVASIERLGPHTWGGPIQQKTQCTGWVDIHL